MYSFGKNPPRSLKTFGVAGLLSRSARIYYDNLFSPKGLGRVSDVLSARLREHGLDDLRLRALLLFAFFEAYEGLGMRGNQGTLPEPLVIECGVDEERVAVGVSFNVIDPGGLRAGDLAARASEGRAENALESLLQSIHSHADHVVLKFDAARSRVEVIALLAIPGAMEVPERQPVTFVELSSAPGGSVDGAAGEAGEAGEDPPGEYIQLGDLDYPELLQDDRPRGPVVEKRERRAGELLAEASQARSASAADSGETDEPETAGGPGSKAREDKDYVRISGVTEKIGEQVIRVGGAHREDTQPESGIMAVIGKVLPFAKRKRKQAAAESLAAEADTGAAGATSRPVAPLAEGLAEAMAGVGPVEQPGPDPAPVPEGDDAKIMVQSLINDLQDGSFAKIIEQGQEHARELRKAGLEATTQKLWDGFLGQISIEKVRLLDTARKVGILAKQKELELKQKETSFMEELRRRDEVIRQKSLALARAKDQMAQWQASTEKLKTAGGAEIGELAFRQKYNVAQKQQLTLKEENLKLANKVDELKSQLASAQLEKKSAGASVTNEMTALKGRVEQLNRRYTQMRILNEQLLKKAKASAVRTVERAENKGSVEEIRKKLDSTLKHVANQERDIAQLRIEKEEAQREETRLKGELNRAQTELKGLKIELTRLHAKKGGSSAA